MHLEETWKIMCDLLSQMVFTNVYSSTDMTMHTCKCFSRALHSNPHKLLWVQLHQRRGALNCRPMQEQRGGRDKLKWKSISHNHEWKLMSITKHWVELYVRRSNKRLQKLLQRCWLKLLIRWEHTFGTYSVLYKVQNMRQLKERGGVIKKKPHGTKNVFWIHERCRFDYKHMCMITNANQL